MVFMNKNSKHSKLNGKGFYIALCASIVTVGAAGAYAYHQTADKLKNQLSELPQATEQPEVWHYEDFTEDVNVPKDDVPKTTEETNMQTEPPAETTEPVKKKTESKPSKSQPFIIPMNGEIINPYSNGELVKSVTLNTWKTHDGIDIEGTLGDAVKSMTSGKVTDVKEDPLWGVCVIIDHGNGIEGHYYNLNKMIPVKVGEEVSAGTVIGSIGDTADCEIAENSHLHFGVKKNGDWVDPSTLIQDNFN